MYENMKFLITRLLWLVVLLLPNFELNAQDPGLTPLDVAKIKYVSWFDVSADASQAVYGLMVPRDPLVENEAPDTHLYLLNIESGQSSALVTNLSVSAGVFRPNSQSITFLVTGEGEKDQSIYAVPAAGGSVTKLFGFDRSITDYGWSNKGDKLLFTSRDELQKSEAPYEPEIYEENLAYTRAYIYDTGTGEVKMVPIEGSVYSFEWSPDDSKIALCSSPTPLVDDFYVKQQISIIDVESLRETGKVDHQAKLGPFCWSPDGTRIALIAGADINDPTEGRLFIAGENGGTSD
jgi:Tol biopolymer transport system component